MAGWRRPDPKDRRGKLIVLTDPGKRLIDEAIGRHVANEERLLLSLTQAEQETLDALLKELIAAGGTQSRLKMATDSLMTWRSRGRRWSRVIIAGSGHPLQAPRRLVIGGRQRHSVFRPLLRGG